MEMQDLISQDSAEQKGPKMIGVIVAFPEFSHPIAYLIGHLLIRGALKTLTVIDVEGCPNFQQYNTDVAEYFSDLLSIKEIPHEPVYESEIEAA
jgi:hypothetical protein